MNPDTNESDAGSAVGPGVEPEAAPQAAANDATGREAEPGAGVDVDARSAAGAGPWFVNVGMDDPRQVLGFDTARPYNRHWELCREHGYLCAGGGDVYTGPFFKLQEGAELFAYQARAGYVGHGIVLPQPPGPGGSPVREARYLVLPSGRTLAQTLAWPGLNPLTQPAELWEWGIAVQWLKTFPLEEAQKSKGIFAGRLTACQLRDPQTLAFLRERFGG